MSTTKTIDTGIRKAQCLHTRKKNQVFTPLKQQEDVKNFFINSPYRGLLLYHLLGSGKTCTSIIIADEMLKLKKIKKVYVCTPGALRQNFINEYCKKCGFDKQNLSKYTFITYNTNIFDSIKKLDFNNSLVIIDEAHNLINGAKNVSQNPYSLYNQILNSNARVLVLTATVIFSNVLEWCLLGNLLKDKAFPDIIKNKRVDLDMEMGEYNVFNDEKMSGIISYFPGDRTEYPEVINKHPIHVLLSTAHSGVLSHVMTREVERAQILASKLKKGQALTPIEHTELILCQKRIRSRAISNIFYKYIDAEDKEDEDIADLDIDDLDIDDLDDKFAKLDYKISTIIKILSSFDDLEHEETGKPKKKQKVTKQNIIKKLKEDGYKEFGEFEYNEIDKALKKYNTILKRDNLVSMGGMIDHEFLKNRTLAHMCPKIVAIIVNILKHFDSKHVIFSFFINKSGLLFIHNILKICGINTEIYSGEVSDINRNKILNQFNSEDNRYGKNIKVLLVTEAGCEGITMLEVENVHFLEINPNTNKTLQCIGRSARFRSHVNMPEDKKKVNIWKYYATPTNEIINYDSLKSFHDYYNFYIEEEREPYLDMDAEEEDMELDEGVDAFLDSRSGRQIIDYEKFYKILQKYSIENTGLIYDIPKPIEIKSPRLPTKTNAEIVRNILENHEGETISKKELKKTLKEMNIVIEKEELNDILKNL